MALGMAPNQHVLPLTAGHLLLPPTQNMPRARQLTDRTQLTPVRWVMNLSQTCSWSVPLQAFGMEVYPMEAVILFSAQEVLTLNTDMSLVSGPVFLG